MAVSNTGNGIGAIQSLGIGSGLDIQSLVRQLVTVEGAPTVTRLTRQASQVGAQLSAVSSLKGALSAFQAVVTPLKDTRQFQVLTATSADNTLFSATADSTAVPGSYAIEVTQLAQADKLISKEYAGGATTAVGTGTLTVNVGSKSMALAIGTSNNTVAGIRDAINGASNNPGVQATLINSSTGSRLVLTATSTGAANTVRLQSSGGGLAQLEYAGGASPNWTLNQQAQDASVKIAGAVITSASNTLTGAIDGVALTLNSTSATGVTTNLGIASDQSAVIANVRRFVDSYNAMRKQFSSLSYYDAASKTAGPLLADPMMNGIDAQMRRLGLNQVNGLTGPYTALATIGIVSDTKGQLTLDQSKLTAALNANRNAVAQLFGSTDGIATRLDTALTQQLSATGTIAARNQSLTSSQKSIIDQQTAHQARMAQVQQRYLTQFTALDSLMSQMKQTSSFLSQQLSGSSSTTG
jgi:flagellar hook-associated protein 2